MTTPKVEILSDQSALVQRALELVVKCIQQAVAERGYCTLALAGGSTPKPLYTNLAQQDLPWNNLYIFWGDERFVPVDHPDSNAGMAKQAWLDRVPIPAEQVFIIPTEGIDPPTSAQQYETTIKQVFGQLQDLSPDQVPQFDIILLGMGDDGHTASLFPHTDALSVRDKLITVGDKGGEPRITFTVSLLNHGRMVMFLTAGANKQQALKQVFSTEAEDFAFPSRMVRPIGELWWLLDEQAAATLNID